MAPIVVDQVQSRAQTALRKSPFYELRDLQVARDDHGLVLSGCVSSFYHKQLAQEVVRSVSTGVKVVNSIHVNIEEDDQ
jgi:hypothetical protein